MVREADPGWRIAALLMAVLGGCACSGDDASGSVESASSSSPTSSGDAASSVGSTAITTSTTAANDDGGSSTTWTYELPEGCGDGVIEPGVACYRAVPLDDERPQYGVALDVDRDGNDDVVAGFDEPSGAWLRRYVFQGEGFVEAQQVDDSLLWYYTHTEFDVDGDGGRDIITMQHDANDGELWWWSTAGGQLGSQMSTSLDPDSSQLFNLAPIPVDVRGDGWPELLVVRYDGTQSSRDVELMSREDGEWTSLGVVAELDWGCGQLTNSVRVDLDDDGDKDLITFDKGDGCDPYVGHYDPAFHRFLVFLNDRVAGNVEYVGNFPIGAMPGDAIWARDFDEDGRGDVLFEVAYEENSDEKAGLGVILHGLGDGLFEPPELVGVGDPRRLQVVGNFLGVHDRGALLYGGDPDLIFVVEDVTNPVDAVPIMDPEKRFATGDFNGDGLVDLVTRSPEDSDRTQVLLSYP